MGKLLKNKEKLNGDSFKLAQTSLILLSISVFFGFSFGANAEEISAEDFCFQDSENPPCNGAYGNCFRNPNGSPGGFVAFTATVKYSRWAFWRAGTYIAPTAQVCENATISKNARVLENAVVKGNAIISGNAIVSGNAVVSGDAIISGKAVLSGNAQVFDRAKVSQKARISNDAMVFGNAQISGRAQVYGNSRIYESAEIFDDVQVYGNAQVFGNARLFHQVEVYENSRVYGNIFINRCTKLGRGAEINELTRIDEFLAYCRNNNSDSDSFLQPSPSSVLQQHEGFTISTDDPASNSLLMRAKDFALEKFKQDHQNELSCPICHESFHAIKRGLVTRCNHLICEGCLNQLKQRKKMRLVQCPLCRSENCNQELLRVDYIH